MNKEKISSQEIIDLVASKASVSKRAAEEFLKVMIATIEDALMANDIVKIKGFGTFKLLWNEPRKSVNVQTGEEIILDGYYKVSFAPEQSLKELVNEPFSHLEPVQIDNDNNFIVPEQQMEEVLDPLRIFTEQASEIKDLLSEIQALSNTKQVEEDETLPVSIPKEYELIDLLLTDNDVEPSIEFIEADSVDEPEIQVDVTDVSIQEIEPKEELVDLPVIVDVNIVEAVVETVSEAIPADVVPEPEIIPAIAEAVVEETVHESPVVEVEKAEDAPELDSTLFLANNKSKRKNKSWIWISAAILLVAVSVCSYLFYPPVNKIGNKVLSKCETEFNYIKDKVSFAKIAHAVSGWFSPEPQKVPVIESVVIPKDTSKVDSTEMKEPIDTLQQMFDNPREYSDFIASEQIKAGSRLTIMSVRYYGTKDFWVYIYEANKDRIPDPDDIEIGTLIRIPKLDPRLIDASNPRCMQKARELHDQYVKKKS